MERETNAAFTGTIEGAVCTACSCLCDDISLTLSSGHIATIEKACEAGRERLASLGPLDADLRIDGAVATVDDGDSRLLSANAALIVIGPNATLEAQREALILGRRRRVPVVSDEQLAGPDDRLGIDAPEVTATLGEVRAHSDLVIFWECDPASTHPRHLERYSFEPPLRHGGARRVVLIDEDEALAGNATRTVATRTISIPRETGRLDFALELLRGDGSDESPLHALEASVAESRHVHLFLGAEAFADAMLRDALHTWAARQRSTRLVTISALAAPGNARGARELTTWTEPPCSPRQALACADLVISVGSDLTAASIPEGAVHLEINSTGLDPRTRSTVVRSDGIFLTLCGRGHAGVEDPSLPILRALQGPETQSAR